ncbi:MAG: lipid-A-disaccharide synthase [Legionellaceae bacterium]
MQALKHLVIVAGEESGDQYAAELIHALKLASSSLSITGIGGAHMQQAGVTLISDLARYGVTGFSEIIRHLGTIRSAEKAIRQHLEKTQPDLLLLIDYPGFNLRLARFAKEKLNIRVFYYISPQLWAWKPKRIHTLKKYVDHMAVIFPFEKKIYETAGIPVSFVGHPLVPRIHEACQTPLSKSTFNLPAHKKIIAFLPGSRTHEIERLMPVLYETAQRLSQQHPDLHFVIPIAQTIDPKLLKSYWLSEQLPCTFVMGHAIDVVRLSDAVIVASGTASLECALIEKPMLIIYKVSFLTALVVSQVIKIKYMGLCNILQNRMIVPEFLQYDCNATALTQAMIELLTQPTLYAQHQSRLKALKISLAADEADTSLFQLVYDALYRE